MTFLEANSESKKKYFEILPAIRDNNGIWWKCGPTQLFQEFNTFEVYDELEIPIDLILSDKWILVYHKFFLLAPGFVSETLDKNFGPHYFNSDIKISEFGWRHCSWKEVLYGLREE